MNTEQSKNGKVEEWPKADMPLIVLPSVWTPTLTIVEEHTDRLTETY